MRGSSVSLAALLAFALQLSGASLAYGACPRGWTYYERQRACQLYIPDLSKVNCASLATNSYSPGDVCGGVNCRDNVRGKCEKDKQECLSGKESCRIQFVVEGVVFTPPPLKGKKNGAGNQSAQASSESGSGAGTRRADIQGCAAPDPAGDPGDLGMNLPASDEPLCLNASKGIESESSNLPMIRDGSVANLGDSKALQSVLENSLKDRLPSLGLDLGFIKSCVGYVPNDLFRYRFEDSAAPSMSLAEVADGIKSGKLASQLRNECLKVEVNPAYAQWAQLLKLGSRNFNYTDGKDSAGNPIYKTCQNIPDERYFSAGGANGIPFEAALAMNAASGVDIGALVSGAQRGLNANTADALNSALTFDSTERRTFLPRSAIQSQVCPAGGPGAKKPNGRVASSVAPISPTEINGIVDRYKSLCGSYDSHYENVKFVATVVEDVVIIEVAGGLIVLTGGGALPVFIGSTFTASALSYARSNNQCLNANRVNDDRLGSVDREGIIAKCHGDALSTAGQDALFSAVTAGLGKGAGKLFEAAEGRLLKRWVTEEATRLTPEMLSKVQPALRAATLTGTKVTQVNINLMVALSRCAIANNGDYTKCDARDIARKTIISTVVGDTIAKTGRAGSIEKLTQKLRQVQKNPEIAGLKTSLQDPEIVSQTVAFKGSNASEVTSKLNLLGRTFQNSAVEGQKAFVNASNGRSIESGVVVKLPNGSLGVRVTQGARNGTVITDPNEVWGLDGSKPLIRTRSDGSQVAVLYRTLTDRGSSLSPNFAKGILTDGLQSAGRANATSGQGMRRNPSRTDVNPADVLAMANATRDAMPNPEYMPFTSDPVFAGKAFGAFTTRTVIVEVEVPLNKVTTDNQLKTQPWRQGRYKFTTDSDWTMHENEYTFTGHYLNSRYVNKVYEFEPGKDVQVYSRKQ